jgi:hypothetical protein
MQRGGGSFVDGAELVVGGELLGDGGAIHLEDYKMPDQVEEAGLGEDALE